MAGRHSRPAARPALVPRRSRLVEMIDARTDEAPLLTYGALAAGRCGRGRYIAVCGADVLPHSLAAPPLRACRGCTIPAQRTKGGRR